MNPACFCVLGYIGNNWWSVENCTICQEVDLPWVIFNCFVTQTFFQRWQNLCSSKIRLHFLYFINCWLDDGLTVFLTLFKEKFVVRAKWHNVEVTLLWETFKEDDKSFFSFCDPFPIHRPTSIDQENILSSDFRHVELLFFPFFCVFLCIFHLHFAESRNERHNCLGVVVGLTNKNTWFLELFKGIAKGKIFIGLHLFFSHSHFPHIVSNGLRMRIYFMSFWKHSFQLFARLNPESGWPIAASLNSHSSLFLKDQFVLIQFADIPGSNGSGQSELIKSI